VGNDGLICTDGGALGLLITYHKHVPDGRLQHRGLTIELGRARSAISLRICGSAFAAAIMSAQVQGDKESRACLSSHRKPEPGRTMSPRQSRQMFEKTTFSDDH
jgi:hypothetical protein